MEHQINPYGAIIPKRTTQSCRDYLEEITQSELFLVTAIIGNDFALDNIDLAREKLAELYEESDSNVVNSFIQAIKSKEIDSVFDIMVFQEFYGQMVYARSIDNVITYFKDLLSEVIRVKPKVLSSKEQVSLDFLLRFDSIEKMYEAVAEKKIDELFYGGVEKIENFFISRLGLNLFENDTDRFQFKKATKYRNLIVHNRGRIDEEFIKEFKEPNFDIGDKIIFSYLDISQINVIFSNYLIHLDHKVAEKFHLKVIDNY